MTKHRTIGKRETLLLFASTAFTLICCTLLGEGVLRYRERTRVTVPGTMPQLYYRHERYGHALVQNAGYYRWVRTNERGFRGSRPTPLIAPKGTVRLFAVGGSTTFDAFVSADSTAWPARLERDLQTLGNVNHVEVVNAGVSGYAIQQDLARLQDELLEFSPDALLFLQGHNDLFALLGSRRPITKTNTPSEAKPFSGTKLWLERNSMLYSKLAARLGVLRFLRRKSSDAGAGGTGNGIDESTLQWAERRYRQHVRSYLAVARAHGIPVVVLPLNHVMGISSLAGPTEAEKQMWNRTVPFASAETVLEGYRRFNAVLAEVSAEYGARMLDPDSLVVVGKEAYAESDPIHFNDMGARRFSLSTARSLLRDSSFVLRVMRSSAQASTAHQAQNVP